MIAVASKTNPDVVVVPVATLEVYVCVPVPEVTLKAVLDAELPILIVSAPVPPVPMLIVSAPVAPVPAMLIIFPPVPEPILMAVYAVLPLPIFRAVVAPPPKDNVVAVVLKTVAVVVDVVMSAEVEPLTARSPTIVVSPELATVNLVVPEAEAVKMSWLWIWLTISAEVPENAIPASGRIAKDAVFVDNCLVVEFHLN